MSDLLNVSETAVMLRVTVATVWKWRDAGRLPCVRISPRKVFFRRADVEAILAPTHG